VHAHIQTSLITALAFVACTSEPTASAPAATPDMGVLAAQGGNKCAVVTVFPSAITLQVGGVVALVGTVANKKGVVLADAPVAWSSQNNAVAAVSSNGVVTGVSPGAATITVTCETGLSASSSITVTP